MRTIAEARGIDVNTLRLKLLIERLLARLFAEPDPPWRLKGGYAMELRLRTRARATKDLDLACSTLDATPDAAGGIAAIREHLQVAADRDLGDFLIYRIGEAGKLIEAAPGGGARFGVVVALAGREYGRFHVDVGVGPLHSGHAEQLTGDDLLDFAGIEPAVALAVPREVQFAEKVMAYTRPWGDRVNTRTKDLIDLLLLIDLGLNDRAALHEALSDTIAARPGRTLPSALPAPPADWRETFQAMAEEVGLQDTDLDAGFRRLQRFWDELHPGGDA
ncbi:MAG: nucleotidyl transferase AbiEii/AbiGii toxin family protein [Planctomycetota bacterium]